MEKRSVLSSHDGLVREGFVVAAPGGGRRPAVLLFPNFLGPDHVVMPGQELRAAGCDWQIHCYGGAVHGFTCAREPEEGMPLNALADERSWKSAADFPVGCFA